MSDRLLNYNAGAVTALSYMAELGSPKKDIFEVAGIMGIVFEDIDESDYGRLTKAFGDLTPPNNENEEEISSDILSSLLSLVSLEVSRAEIETWSSEKKEQAKAYASAVHLAASDNDCKVPEKPNFLPDAKTYTGLWD